MGIIAVVPLRIGDKVVSPGYELTPEDMVGRNVDMMKRHDHVKWVDDPAPRRRGRSQLGGEDE